MASFSSSKKFSSGIVSALLGLGLAVLPTVLGLWHNWVSEQEAVYNVNQKNLYKRSVPQQFFKKFMVAPKPSQVLVSSKGWLPAGGSSNTSLLLAAGEKCEQASLHALPVTAEEKKWARWFLSECNAERLPPAFFTSPPFITPMGGSFVFWHLVYSKQAFDKKHFLRANFAYLHLIEHWQSEAADILPPPFLPEERNLSINALESFKNGEFMTLTPKFMLFHTNNNEGFQVTPIAEVERELAAEGYTLSRSSECFSFYHEPRSCLRALPFHQLNSLPLILTFTGYGLILFGLMILGVQLHEARQNQAKTREILLHTLSHEMRHPASSLRLSLEVLRGQYDNLPGAAQGEFLRMSTQLQRMNRLMQLAAGAGGGAAVGHMSVNRVDDLVYSAVETYKEKINLQQLPENLWIRVDAPWFNLCLQNLIKNSLIHGKAPVTVSVHQENGEILVCVSDQGELPLLTFADMIQPEKKSSRSPGMGLGLSITHSVLEQMEAQLRFQTSPKQFQMVFKQQQPEEQRKVS